MFSYARFDSGIADGVQRYGHNALFADMYFLVARFQVRLMLVACAIVLVSAGRDVRACGMSWSLPKGHFERVDSQGYASYWELIGEIDCGEGLRLPLQINFNAGRESGAPSPILGQGWLLPLLESKFIQESEDRFCMIQPDGWNNIFLRAEPNGTTLNGSAGWKGEIDGDSITAWAACGWKLVYAKGRIVTLVTPKGRRLDWVYEGNRVASLREGSTTRLKVEYDLSGQAQSLTLGNDKRILLVHEKKPRVQSLAGQNVITGVDDSLASLTLANGQYNRYEFSIDAKRLPTLTVSQVNREPKEEAIAATPTCVLSWDPQTKYVVQDGGWTYRVTPPKAEGGTAEIARSDARGKQEYWFKDATNSQETIQGADGVKTVTSWFASGKLAGAIRKKVRIMGGESTTIYQASYDENGKIFREIFEDGSINQFKYADGGKKISEEHSENGKSGYTVNFDSGHITSVHSADGRTLQYYYDEKGREIKLVIDGKIHSSKTYAPDASWEETVVFDSGSDKPSRTLRKEFDKSGRVTLDKITEHTKHEREFIKRFTYDDLGRLAQQVSSKGATVEYLYNTDGKRVGKRIKDLTN